MGQEDWFVKCIFLLTCFYFIRFAVMGYKDVIIMILSLQAIQVAVNLKEKKSTKLNVFFGVLLGLMSLINYSGIVIAGIIFLTHVLNNPKIVIKPKELIINLGIILLIASMELKKFIFWATVGGINTNDDQNTISNITNTNITHPYAQIEFDGYGIVTNIDIYIKGKFQAFTQYHYFGLIFFLFLIVLMFRARKMRKKNVTKWLFIYMSIFFSIFFDPFNINQHAQAYVLTISPKYWLLLLPPISILVSSQHKWWMTFPKKIKNKWMIGVMTLMLLSLVKIFPNSNQILMLFIEKTFGYFTPFYRESSYYLEKLNFLYWLILAGISVGLFYWMISKFFKKSLFKKNRSILIALILYVISVVPFISSLDTEYDLSKLSGLKEENSLNRVINFNKSNRLFYPLVKYFDQNIESGIIITNSGYYAKLAYYLDRNRFLVKPFNTGWYNNMKCDNKNYYLLFNNKDSRPENIINIKKNYTKIFSNDGYVIYKCLE